MRPSPVQCQLSSSYLGTGDRRDTKGCRGVTCVLLFISCRLTTLRLSTALLGLTTIKANLQLQEEVLTYVSVDFELRVLGRFRVFYAGYHRPRILGATVMTQMEVNGIRHYGPHLEILDLLVWGTNEVVDGVAVY